jgi:hypothetical protein
VYFSLHGGSLEHPPNVRYVATGAAPYHCSTSLFQIKVYHFILIVVFPRPLPNFLISGASHHDACDDVLGNELFVLARGRVPTASSMASFHDCFLDRAFFLSLRLLSHNPR